VAVGGEAAGDPAPGHEEDVGGGDVGEGGLDPDGHEAVVVGDGAGLGRAQHDLEAGPVGQHLVRADEVEGGEPRVQADGDLHGPS
jgi:hypothetical protein